ncbi:AMP-binding protein [Actinophytocola oryzae]|uniref:Long-chain acyl-CoA synthetase n=1 Tax=Actinophytocola oryzae TaxID=502181 RepID=A0A4R7VCY8_9PSEU|nr:AMP-binding protein [Actinophytocola oryzae]TDV46974.1 long-chain acyl-CoA synthetase [Actinophytocola oryzae]
MVDALTGNVAELVAEAAERAPRRAALVDAASGRTMDWARTNAAVDAYVGTLDAAGLRPGDRVVVPLPNGPEFCVALFGILRAGGVAVPAAATSPELPNLVEDSGATLVVGDTVPVPDPDASAEPVEARNSGEDTAVLCYTSGTAGVPRGVMLSHRALLSNVRQCAQLRPAPVTASDRVLLVVPLFHLYGLGPGLLQVTSAAATAVLLDSFGTDRTLKVCADNEVTALVGVPAMYQALTAADPEHLARGLASVRLMTSGAAPLSPSVLSAMKDATGLHVFEGYGLTETGPVLTSTLVGGVAKPGSVGRPLPGVELRLVDTDGDPAGTAADPDEEGWFDEDEPETGRIAAKGPNLFSGYWPDGTGGPDEEGWFRTGDVGYLDSDGDLRLVDRAGDLIIVNGFNVYPNEVERVLAELPEVAEAAAVGVPDDRTGEQVMAVLVLAPGATLTEDEVRDHCASRLARFKVPSTVQFADELPHSPTGKVRRSTLRGSVT